MRGVDGGEERAAGRGARERRGGGDDVDGAEARAELLARGDLREVGGDEGDEGACV